MKNELKLLAEFQSILETYSMSEATKNELKKTQLVLLAAPSSAGRNTIIHRLLTTDKYHYIVSDTTRHPRINDGVKEQNGKTYWFKSEQQVLEGLANGKYLEAAIIHNQQVSGISIQELLRAKKQNKIAITDIEIQGVKALTGAKPDTVTIFILPPNFEEWMRRLNQRGYMHGEERKRRLDSSVKEFEHALHDEDFILIINDDLEQTTDEITRLMTAQKADMKRQDEGKQLISQLIQQIEKL